MTDEGGEVFVAEPLVDMFVQPDASCLLLTLRSVNEFDKGEGPRRVRYWMTEEYMS